MSIQKRRLSAMLLAALAFAAIPLHAQTIPTASSHLGIAIGSDRVLADYHQIAGYLRMLDRVSERVEVVSLGKTTLGNDMLMAVISSEANLKNQTRIREIAKKLADPRGLSDAEIDALAREGKAVVLVTLNIHASEIAASQMALEWAHALATAQDAETKRRLDNVVLLLVPSLNPDGQIMETEWYRKWLGTPYEGSQMPWLYHPYVGHDNNRDWYMLTQKETRNVSQMVYHQWFPQLFVDEHQMGTDGPRMFIPPYADPLDPDIHPLIWREVNLVGTNMAFRLEQQQKAGVIWGYSFDAYWLGGTRNTGWWKNITGLLLEIASAQLATPVYVDPTELRGGSKGLVDYKAQVNHPNPWKGGWWRMRDIMDYERIASDALLEIAADRREDLLRDIATRARAAVVAGEGVAFRIPRDQRDYPTARRMAGIFADHKVDVFLASNGDFWIPLAQPYSKFIHEMLEPQRYPEVRLVAGRDILPPYDVATWTLPLMMGVTVEKRGQPLPEGLSRFEAPMLRANGSSPIEAAPLPEARYVSMAVSPEAYRVVNAVLAAKQGVWTATVPDRFVIEHAAASKASAIAAASGIEFAASELPPDATKLTLPRVGLYRPWAASMDEGWTRWLLEQYGFPLTNLENKAIASPAEPLARRYDAIILPDVARETIAEGRARRSGEDARYVRPVPPEFAGGIGKEGAASLKTFVEQGGTLIALNSSTDWVLENFNLPVRNALSQLPREQFYIPGSLLRVSVNRHPVTFGMPGETALMFDEGRAFQTSLPGAELGRAVLAAYPEDARDVLLSGWARGEERLTRRAAAVAVTFGKGRIVLFGFRPQHRAQTHATFPMLFNALYWK
jgi:hypothetical protein